MRRPITAKLTEELKLIQKKWLESDRQTQDVIFYREFAPRFAPLFAELPLHGWIGERTRFKAIISVLGFSWQPVALMAAWAKPDYALLIGSKESLNMRVDGDSVQDAIKRISEFPDNLLGFRPVEAEMENTIR